MGLAASQGKLLLLTARKSDLEYRAQEVSQRRLLLATDMEDISMKYARKTANRQMKVASKLFMSEANQTKYVNLTYKTLMSLGKTDITDTSPSSYRLKNAMGQIVVPDDSDLPTEKTLSNFHYVTSVPLKDDSGKIVMEEDGVTPKMKMANLSVKSVVDHATGATSVIVSGTDANDKQIYDTYVVDKKLTDNSETENPLQEGIRNGDYIIEHFAMKDEDPSAKWSPFSWSGSNLFDDSNYTGDDAAAQAEYQAASAKVQSADKRLEMELKQIETQHKAVETEVESVQKVIQNNIEGSFKLFA